MLNSLHQGLFIAQNYQRLTKMRYHSHQGKYCHQQRLSNLQ
jgi:hypothetical protein